MTKKDKKAKCKKLLYKNKLTKEDKVWLINEVFKLHKDYNKKSKDAIDIVRNSVRNTKCFSFLNKNGLRVDISYPKCFNWPTKKEEVNKTLRDIIDPQIKLFKKKNNLPLNFQVDHYGLEFKDIVNLFMVGKDFDQLHKNIICINTKNKIYSFKDINLVNEFYDLHKSVAKLQGLSKEEHKIKTYKWDV